MMPTSHFVNWRGADIHYVDEGQGIPVLMIHGFGGSFINFQQLAGLMKSNYRVIRIDLPGFGLSDFPGNNGSNEDFLSDYRNFMTFFLDTLKLDSVYLIGNSMGGGVAWLTAADHPDKVKKLVLLASAGYDLKEVTNKLFLSKTGFIDKILEKGVPQFFSAARAQKVFFDPGKADTSLMRKNTDVFNRQGNIPHVLAMIHSDQIVDTALIQHIQCPTLILWGKQDQVVPVEHAARFKRDIKYSEVIIYDSCGHVPMMEWPLKVQHDVNRFFSVNTL
jgi:pimeloyl-ACP methyl ester carboxylesterase